MIFGRVLRIGYGQEGGVLVSPNFLPAMARNTVIEILPSFSMGVHLIVCSVKSDTPSTPPIQGFRCKEVALNAGLRRVRIGNIHLLSSSTI